MTGVWPVLLAGACLSAWGCGAEKPAPVGDVDARIARLEGEIASLKSVLARVCKELGISA